MTVILHLLKAQIVIEIVSSVYTMNLLTGCGLTTFALCYGLYSFSTGRRGTSQNMMRLRVMAQGFTVAALMLGIAKTSMS